MLNIFAIIFLIGAVQSTILGVGLGIRKENSVANRYLIVILGLFVFNFIKLIVDESGFYRQFSGLIYGDASIALLYGPLFYFYVRALTTKRSFAKQDLLHFIPFLVHLAIVFPAYLLDHDAKVRAYEAFLTNGFTRSYQPLLTYGMKIVQYLSYLILCIFMIKKYKDEIKDHLSNTYRTDLSWLMNLFFVNAGFLAMLFTALILHATGFFTMNHHFTRVSYLWDMVLIFTFSIMALRQSPVFQVPENIIENSNKPQSDETDKYGSARLEKETVDSVLKELLEYVENEKPYLDPELTVSTLGEKISLPRHIISQVINSGLKMNFYSFINGYRIEEAKKMFEDTAYKDKNIIEIAYMAGFTSKSHFNLSFKKATGLTPKEFRRTIKSNIS
ncbi:MAG TPA: AraC family transcriptional regulator [bacterium]|nr:AraC family transcriptional regulator [bacterium]